MVFFYYANLIGYVRVICLLVTIYTAFKNPVITVISYTINQALDFIDGPVARRYNQCSQFGATLDMIIDRVSETVILAVLGQLFPDWSWLFFLLIILDISSHWFQISANLLNKL